MTVNATHFLNAVFSSVCADEQVALAFTSRTGGIPAQARSPEIESRVSRMKRAGYVSISTVGGASPSWDKKHQYLSRTNIDFRRCHVIVCDDVGTKVDASRLPQPDYIIETSQGNYQYGYLIEPCSDAQLVEAMINALIAEDLTDSGANGRMRLVRIPGSLHKTGFRARVVEWNVDLHERTSLEELAEDFGLELTKRSLRQANAPKPDPRLQDEVYAWLDAKGYLREGDDGSFVNLQCPLSREDGTHVYSEVAGYSPLGHGQFPEKRVFHCFHSHNGRKFGTKEFLRWVENEGGPKASSTIIGLTGNVVRFKPHDVAKTVSSIRDVLIASGEAVFERSERPIRLDELEPREQEENGIIRQGGVVVRRLEVAHLRVILSDGFEFQKMYANGKWKPVAPPREDLASYLGTTSKRRGLRRLNGIVSAPTLAPGSYEPILEPGYDEPSGLFLNWFGKPLRLPTPDKAATESAYDIFDNLLAEAAFENPDLGFSCWMASLLSVLLRPIVGQAPLFLLDAPVAGTGKTYLAELIGLIATGYEPPAVTAGWDDDELEKRLGAAAMMGDQVLLIDNIMRELKSETLCTMITSGVIRTRILGKSETRDIPMDALVIGTGNNLQLNTDLARRALTVRLDAMCERPETRRFRINPKNEIRKRRDEYIAAALTLVRGYIAAGSPDQRLAPFQSFEGGFTRIVRATLVWMGLPDPADAVQVSRAIDSQTTDDGALFQALYETFSGQSFSASQLHGISRTGGSENSDIIKGVFGSISTSRGVGMRLRKYQDRIIGRYRFSVARDTRTNTSEFQVLKS